MLSYETKRRSHLHATGRCIGCGSKNDRPSKAYCSGCAHHNATKLRKLRANRSSSGKCYSCGKRRPVKGIKSCRQCRDINNAHTVRRRREDKAKVLAHYRAVCSCCGESEAAFLTADHRHGGGSKHRSMDRLADQNIWRWLVKNGFPDTFRVLCFNCNQATSGGHQCPHQQGRQ